MNRSRRIIWSLASACVLVLVSVAPAAACQVFPPQDYAFNPELGYFVLGTEPDGRADTILEANAGDSLGSQGVVKLGLTADGNVGISTSPGHGWLGLAMTSSRGDEEALMWKCRCEGWGIGDLISGTAGWASWDNGGTRNLVVTDASADRWGTLISHLRVVDAQNNTHMTVDQIAHGLKAGGFSGGMFEIDITVTNVTSSVQNLTYRRVMDWDVPPTWGKEFVSAQNHPVASSARTPGVWITNDGWATANPLAPETDLGVNGPFENNGVLGQAFDDGALFDFTLGSVMPSKSVSFSVFYGAALDKAGALADLQRVGATAYSVATSSNNLSDPAAGAPNDQATTFSFGFGHLANHSDPNSRVSTGKDPNVSDAHVDVSYIPSELVSSNTNSDYVAAARQAAETIRKRADDALRHYGQVLNRTPPDIVVELVPPNDICWVWIILCTPGSTGRVTAANLIKLNEDNYRDWFHDWAVNWRSNPATTDLDSLDSIWSTTIDHECWHIIQDMSGEWGWQSVAWDFPSQGRLIESSAVAAQDTFSDWRGQTYQAVGYSGSSYQFRTYQLLSGYAGRDLATDQELTGHDEKGDTDYRDPAILRYIAHVTKPTGMDEDTALLKLLERINQSGLGINWYTAMHRISMASGKDAFQLLSDFYMAALLDHTSNVPSQFHLGDPRASSDVPSLTIRGGSTGDIVTDALPRTRTIAFAQGEVFLYQVPAGQQRSWAEITITRTAGSSPVHVDVAPVLWNGTSIVKLDGPVAQKSVTPEDFGKGYSQVVSFSDVSESRNTVAIVVTAGTNGDQRGGNYTVDVDFHTGTPPVVQTQQSPVFRLLSYEPATLDLSVSPLGEAGMPLYVKVSPSDDEGAIADASVVAIVTDPSGKARQIQIPDAGIGDDPSGSDGTYGRYVWATGLPGQYTVSVTATGTGHDGSPFTLTDSQTVDLAPSVDSDADGITDEAENLLGLDPYNPADAQVDSDQDGLTLAQELATGTDALSPDTDDGGETDGSEIARGLDPLNSSDDAQVGQMSFSAIAQDGREVALKVDTSAAVGSVQLTRVAADGQRTQVAVLPVGYQSLTDGPLAAGTYTYEAVLTLPSGASAPVAASQPVAVADDVTPPTFDWVVNGDRTEATSTSVEVWVTETSETPTSMRLADSQADLEAAPWVPYEQFSSFQFTSAELGDHTVYLQLEDAAGNVSDPLSQAITLVAGDAAPSSFADLRHAYVSDATLTVPFQSWFPTTVGSVELWERYTSEGGQPSEWSLAASTSTITSPFSITLGSGPGRYELYTIAVDGNGVREAPPPVADTFVVLGIPEITSSIDPIPAVVGGRHVDFHITASDVWGNIDHYMIMERHLTAPGAYSDWTELTLGTGPLIGVTLPEGATDFEFYSIVWDDLGGIEAEVPLAQAQVSVDPSSLPSSNVDALPEFVSSTTIPVTVSATDHGAGIGSVGIYSRCQPDGSPFWSAWSGADSSGWPAPGLSADLACGDARYEFYSVARDWAGNEEVRDPSPDAFTNLDSVTPTSSVGTLPATVTSSELSVPFTASDGDGSVAIVELWQRFKPAGGSAGVWTEVASVTSSPIDVQLASGDGTYDFYTIAIDGAGNEEAVPTTWWLFGPEVAPDATVRLDTTAPTSAVGSLPAAVSGTTLSVPFTATDGPGSGVASVELWARFEAAGSSDWTEWGLLASGATSPFSVALDKGVGRYEFYTVATDVAGNREAAPVSADAFTVLDTGAPATSVDPLASTTTGGSISISYSVGPGTPASSVEIWKRFAAAGSSNWSSWSKVTTVTTSPVSVSLTSGDGTYEFYSIGISGAGLREEAPAVADASIVRDTHAPSSTASGPAYVNDPSISVPYTADDGTGSGVALVELWWRYQAPGGSWSSWSYLDAKAPGNPFDVDLNRGDGTYGFYTIAIDEAGNRESASLGDFSTVLDRTAPTSSAGSLSATTKVVSLSVGYSASDNTSGSGLAPTELWERFRAAGSSDWGDWSLVTTRTSSPFSVTLDQGDGRYEFYTIAIDRSGNREAAPATADSWTVLDTETPTSSVGSLPAFTTATSITVPYSVSLPDPSGTDVSVQLWRRSQNPTTLVWSGWSKIATVANGADLVASLGSDGRNEFYTIAVDVAGNTETKAQEAEAFTVRDRTAPSTSVTALPLYTRSASQTIAFSPNDNGGTGVASIVVYGRHVAAGTYTWTAWAPVATLAPDATSVSVDLDAGDGQYEFYFVSTDLAGNVESGGSRDTYTILDTTAPTSNIWSLPATGKVTLVDAAYSASEPSNSSGIDYVDLYVRYTPAGGTAGEWTYLMAATSSPFHVNLAQGDGQYEMYSVATDRAGNHEAPPASADKSTILDTTGETSQAGPITGLTNGTSIQVPYTVTIPDTYGTAVTVELWYRFQAAGSGTWGNWAKATQVANGSTLSTSLGNDGRFEYYTIAVDAAGNREAKDQIAETWTVRDRTAPVTSVQALSSPTSSPNETIAVNTADTNGSGVATVELWQRFQAAGSGSWSSWTKVATGAAGPFSVTLGGDGRYEFYSRGTDVAGNYEGSPSSADAFVILDRTAPTSSVTALPATSSGSGITLTYTSTDSTNSSGVASVELWARYRANDASAWGDWVAAGTSTSSSGSFSFTFDAGSGIYEFATVAVDNLGFREATSTKASVRAISWAASSVVNSDAGSAVQDDAAYAVGPDGTAYAVWDDARDGDQDIYFAERDPSTGAWSSEIKLNTDGGTASQRTPSIAVDGSGNLYVVWADDRAGAGDTDIYFVKRTGTTWSANIKVSDAAAGSVQDQPRIAVTSEGMAVAVWIDHRSGQNNVYSARLAAGGTTWSANYKVTLNTSAAKASPDVALAPNGMAYAVWQDSQSNAGDIYAATLTSTGTSWSNIGRADDDSLSTGVDRSPRVGIAASGNVLVAWLDGRTSAGQVRVRQRTGSSWSASIQVSDASAVVGGGLALAVKSDGGVLVAWDDTRATTSAIWSVQCEAGTSAVTRCAPAAAVGDQSGAAFRPTLAANGEHVYLGWRDDTTGGGDIRFRLRTPS